VPFPPPPPPPPPASVAVRVRKKHACVLQPFIPLKFASQEPKLDNARRIVAEWPALDQEARDFTAKVRFPSINLSVMFRLACGSRDYRATSPPRRLPHMLGYGCCRSHREDRVRLPTDSPLLDQEGHDANAKACSVWHPWPCWRLRPAQAILKLLQAPDSMPHHLST